MGSENNRGKQILLIALIVILTVLIFLFGWLLLREMGVFSPELPTLPPETTTEAPLQAEELSTTKVPESTGEDGTEPDTSREPDPTEFPETTELTIQEPVEEPTQAPTEEATAPQEEPPYYILPDADSRYISESEALALSEEELTLAINELYARHGRIFNTQWIREYFEAQSWYEGTVPASQFSESVFNEYELKNLSLLCSIR